MSQKTEIPPLSEEQRKAIALQEKIKNLSRPVFSRKVIFWLITTILLFGGIGCIFFWFERLIPFATALLVIAGFEVYLLLISIISLPFRTLTISRLKAKLAETSIVSRTEDLQEKLEENFFTNLVKINFKYIDKYYLQTQLQADKSFILSCVAAIISFFIIIAGILMTYFGHNNAPAGYVATAAGILGEFIAAVFFYLYNKTIIKMGQYHQKLVLTQNISLAMKIAEDLEGDNKAQAQMKLVDYLSRDINLYLTEQKLHVKETKQNHI